MKPEFFQFGTPFNHGTDSKTAVSLIKCDRKASPQVTAGSLGFFRVLRCYQYLSTSVETKLPGLEIVIWPSLGCHEGHGVFHGQTRNEKDLTVSRVNQPRFMNPGFASNGQPFL